MCARDPEQQKRQQARRDWLTGLAVCFVLAAAWIADSLYSLPTGTVSVGWAAAIPWIASAVGALASMYGANKAGKAQDKASNQQGQLIKLQQDAANRLMPWGEGLMKQGGAGLTSLLPWYTKAAFGDRTQLQQLMSPELQAIRQNYDRPLQQLTELSPRTGTTAAGNASILAGRAEAQNSALLGARMAGMQGLQGISGQLAGLGSGAVGAAFGGLQGASAGANSLMSQLYNIRQQNSQDSEAIGSSLVDFLKAYQTWNAGRTPTTGGGGGGDKSGWGGTAAGKWG